MDGPVLSGGVIVLVAVLLWVLYLLPSWRGRHQFNTAERNAVRLNQALRVLAETSEAPDEVRLELTARTAHAQQRLAKRLQAQQESARLEQLRQQLAETRRDPLVRQARARRRLRLTASLAVAAGGALVALGAWPFIAGGTWMPVAAGLLLVAGGVSVLVRMARVAEATARRTAHPAEAAPAQRVSPPLHDQGPAVWTPRPLPQPMVSVSGSRAQAAQAEIEARLERDRAARRAELRRRAEELAPAAPTALPVAPAAETATASPYAGMGLVDDAEIEAHVRRLLARRAAG